MLAGPDGVSRFQCPGLARSVPVYCVNGLVFCGPAGSRRNTSLTDLGATDSPAPLRHDALADEVARPVIATIAISGAVIIGVTGVRIAVAIVPAIIACTG